MAASFNPVTPELLDELRNVLGDKFVKTDEDYLERYQTDEEGNSHYFHKPEVVVLNWPTNTSFPLRRVRPVPALPAALSPSTMASSSNWNG